MKIRLNHKLGNGSQRLRVMWSKLRTSLKIIISRSRHRPITILLASLFVFSLVLPLYYGNSVSAFNLYSQSSWTGGVGTDPQTQYAAINNLNAGNDLTLGNTTNSWCSTTHCSNSWTKRKPVYIKNPTADAYIDTVVKLTVTYVPGMKADFSDLRFVATDNTTELGHFLQNKTNSSTAIVFVKVNSIPANSKATINMYYGNTGASSTSDSSIMNLVDDFEKSTTTANLITQWGSYGTGDNNLRSPNSIATDSGNNIFVSDATNARIVKYDSSGVFQMTFGWGVDDGSEVFQVCTLGCQSGVQGIGDGQFSDISGLAINKNNGNIYVLDQGRSDVQVFNSSGVFQFKFGAQGSGNGQMNTPLGIALCSGSVIIADTGNNRIQSWFLNGTYSSSNGSLGSDYGQFNYPHKVTCGTVFDIPDIIAVSDRNNNRIVFAVGDLGMIPNNLPVETLGTGGSGNGELSIPGGVAIDPSQNIYVADGNNGRVQKFNQKGQYLSKWDNAGASDIAIDGVGKIYVSEFFGNRINKYEPPALNPDLGITNPSDSYYTNSDNEVTLVGGNINTPASWDRLKNRTYEFDFAVDLTAWACDYNNSPISYSQHSGADQSLLWFYKYDNCGDINWFALSDLRIDGTSNTIPSIFDPYSSDPQDSQGARFQSGHYLRVRIDALKDGGYRYRISPTGDDNFIDVNPGDYGLTMLDSDLFVNLRIATKFRNIAAYDSLSFDPVVGYGVEEYVGGKSGFIESAVFDAASVYTNFGTIDVNSSGNGNIGIYVRGSDSTSFTQEYFFCSLLSSGANMLDSSCLTAGKRYVQYKMVLSQESGESLAVDSVDLEYSVDTGPPEINASNIIIKKSPSGSVIADGAWTNSASPYFSWTAGQDATGGLGLAGYCLYLGMDSNADPATTSGILPTNSNQNYNGIDVSNACDYATDQTSLDITSFNNNVPIDDGETYYFKIKAIDTTGLIYTGQAESTSFKVDISAPNSPQTLFSAPSGYINSKIFSVDWANIPGVAFTDNHSGIAGIKYCITNFISGNAGCNPGDNNWYGKQHTSGRIDDTSDVIPVNDSTFTTVAADAARLDDAILGGNFIGVVVVDNAGNYAYGNVTNSGVVLITNKSASEPTSLIVSPPSNVDNEYSFSWSAPTTFSGPESAIDYCWTVNDPIAADGSNCNWTGAGITQLANGPYATIQGTNTMYLMAKDQSSNFDSNNVATTTFTASTTAPGPPQNTEISDVSTKATSTWKLALSWSAPDQVGAGVSSYKIFRSASANGTYTQVGSTSPSNLSFIDSGLVQTDYYYHVKACDSANSCSVAGNVVTKKPTGRYTTPASLTADTNQPKVTDIGTKKATITWGTSRDSDSKIAFGTKPGTYNPSEISNSNQTTDHSVSLTNLQPGTTYYYVARWTDEDGNTGASQERSFRTLDAPVVKNVGSKNISISSADVYVTVKDTSSLKLLYGKDEGFGESKSIATSTAESKYDFSLPGLSDGQKYFYKFTLLDASDNEYQSDIYSFTTLPRPRITNLRFQPVEGSPSSTQKVSWTTNVPTTSSISYGPVGQKPLESLKSDLVTEHEITISGLIDNTDYNLTARSTDAAGITATSDSQTFKTALDTRPPKISDVSVETTIRGTGSEAKGQVIVSWKTDEKATSQVAYGQGQTNRLTNSTKEDAKLTTDHVVILSDLTTSSIYSVQPVSLDKGDNETKGDVQSAIIGRPSDNVFSIIYNALRSIFGIDG